MAFVMKRPFGASKGIVVFTHKETSTLSSSLSVLQRLLQRVRERYVVAVHYGWYSRIDGPPAWVDFHFAPEATVVFAEPDRVRRIPMNSSYFVPSYFRPVKMPKQWDVISVTRPAPFKNTDQLLAALRVLKDMRPQSRALVVCATSQRSRTTGMLAGVERQYQELFSPAEREDVVLLPFNLQGAPFPFPRRDVAFLYNASRLFTLFSKREGGSKAIKEALLCGLPLVLDADLEGGGLEFATAKNSRVFRGVKQAAERMAEVLDHSADFEFDTSGLARRISETYTVPELMAHLARTFEELGIPFEGEVDTHELGMKLPSHHSSLERDAKERGWAADLQTHRAAAAFLRGLLESGQGDVVTPTPYEHLRMTAADLRARAKRTAARARVVTRRAAGRVLKA